MGHSIQKYRGGRAIFNDLDLIVLIQLIEEASREEEAGVQAIAAFWAEGLGAYGPGLIWLELDSLLSEEAHRSGMIRCLQAVQRRVESFGDLVPGKMLNDRALVSDVVFNDQFPARFIHEAAARLLQLIDPPPPAATAAGK